MPKVSVIIPTYNQGRFITSTIDSVINQTYKDFEIIIIVDGSTDDTLERLERFGNKIKIIQQENSERAVARNNGVKNSCGEYLAFLDSDDLWNSNKLEIQVKILDTNPDISLVYSTCERIDENSNKIRPAKRQLEGYSGYVYEKLLMRNFIVSPTPIVRRNLFEETTGFVTKYIPYEDWEFWIRFSLKGKVEFIPTPLAYYRIHSAQSVKTITAERIEHATTLLLEDSFKLQEIPNNLRNKALALANLRYCYWYILANNNKTAKEKIKRAIKLYPNFLTDYRWIGLYITSRFPKLKSIINLKQFH